jgi:hypothetical protein
MMIPTSSVIFVASITNLLALANTNAESEQVFHEPKKIQILSYSKTYACTLCACNANH